VSLEQRAEGEPPQIVGLASVYYDGTPDTEYELWQDGPVERIMPGAFRDALAGKDDVRALFNHDANHVLGRVSSGTMELRDTKAGLEYRINPPNTATGRDLLELVRRGDITGSSFGFIVTDEDSLRHDGRAVREVRQVTVLDVGPVTFPAYEATEVQVRSLPDAIREDYERREQQKRHRAARLDFIGRQIHFAALEKEQHG